MTDGKGWPARRPGARIVDAIDLFAHRRQQVIQGQKPEGMAHSHSVPGVLIAATGAGRTWEHVIADVVVVGRPGLVSIGCINPSMPGELVLVFNLRQLGALMNAVLAATETMGEEGAPW